MLQLILFGESILSENVIPIKNIHQLEIQSDISHKDFESVL